MALATAAVAHLVGRFRLSRLPGRVQLRLPAAMPRVLGLWLAGFAALAPVPVLWLPLGAGAVALGGEPLRGDSRLFGVALHVAVLGSAVAYLVRMWGLVVGFGDTDALLGAVPWVEVVLCG